jgi:hypothetical protein
VTDNWVKFEWPPDVAYLILFAFGETRARIYRRGSLLPYQAYGEMIIIPNSPPYMPVAFFDRSILPPFQLSLSPGMEQVLVKYKNMNNYLINSTDRLMFDTMLKRFVPKVPMDMPAKEQLKVWFLFVRSLGQER